MDKQEIQKAQKRELEPRITELLGEIDDIEIQLSQDEINNRDEGWRTSARVARKYKSNELRLCRDRIKVISREELQAAVGNLSKAGRVELARSLDRAIIAEIKILVSPAEFLECIERAKRKIDHEDQLQILKRIA